VPRSHRYCGIDGHRKKSQSISPLRGTGWWRIAHQWRDIGHGKETYLEAKRAVETWEHFRVSWPFGGAQVADTQQRPPRIGDGYIVLAGFLQFWSINPLRVLYVRESVDTQPRTASTPHNVQQEQRGQRGTRKLPSKNTRVKSYRVGSGCLGGHLLAGEERFSIVWDHDTDKVAFEVLSFSRPQGVTGTLLYPVTYCLQSLFGVRSCDAVQAQVRRGRRSASS